MRRLLLFILTVLLPWVARGAVEIGGIWYEVDTNSKTASVTYPNSGSYSGNIVIPSSFFYMTVEYRVTSISTKAFNGNADITGITIPNTMTEIGSSCFNNCSNLVTINIPESVTNIGSDAFVGTAWFNNQPDGMVYAGLVAYKYKGNIDENTTIQIKESTIGLSDRLFAGSNITSVNLPNSLKRIGSYAFADCRNLSTIKLPDNLTTIDYYAFYDCGNLSSIDIPHSVTKIGNNAFFACLGLTSITIPNGITRIETGTFRNCENLSSIYIPQSVTSIGENALHGTAWFNNQPDGMVYAGSVAYKYKGNMPSNTSIQIKNGTIGIADNAFTSSKLASISMPDGLINIGRYVFQGCSDLRSVTVPNSVKTIGSYAFGNCSNLTSINLSSNLDAIEAYTFAECKNLSSITIPESVTLINTDAFWQCTGLTSITLPKSVTNIGPAAFSDCTGLTSITLSRNVNKISNSAFANCTSLTDVYCYATTVPTCDATIFNNATLSSVTLHVPASSIDAYRSTAPWKSFGTIVAITLQDGDEFTALTAEGVELKFKVVSANDKTCRVIGITGKNTTGALTIPETAQELKVVEIADISCSGLTSITIPSSVTTLEKGSLRGCPNVKDLYCYALTPPDTYWGYAFDGWNLPAVTLHVPASALNTYKTTAYWSDFGTIVAIDGTGGDEQQGGYEEDDYVSEFNGKIWNIGQRGDFESVNAAMQSPNVKDGDILYVDHTGIGKGVTITKRVWIIGMGSGKSYMHYTTVIEAEGVKLTGLCMEGIELRDNHITIERCYVDGNITAADNYECDRASIRACVVRGYIDGNADYPAEGWDIQNNVIAKVSANNNVKSNTTIYPVLTSPFLVGNLEKALLNHNLIYTSTGQEAALVNVEHSDIKNNIMVVSSYSIPPCIAGCTSSTILRNYISAGDLPDNNKPESYLSNGGIVFSRIENLDEYVRAYYNRDNYADDGTCCGPYGGSYQFDPSYRPEGLPFVTNLRMEEKNLKFYLSIPTSQVYLDCWEYFWDNDPGVGKGTVTRYYSTNFQNVNVTAELKKTMNSMTEGMHVLFVRAKSTTGMWSHTYAIEVNVTHELQTVEMSLDPENTYNLLTHQYQTLAQLMNGLTDLDNDVQAQVAVADGTYEMTFHSSNMNMPENPTYQDVIATLEMQKAEMDKNFSQYNNNYYRYPASVIMTAPTHATLKFYLFSEEIRTAIAQGISKVEDPSQQMALLAQWNALDTYGREQLSWIVSQMTLVNISVFIESRFVAGEDDFQVEPNDLLALKNIYQALGGSGWTSKRWSFVNNGRVREDFPGVTFTDEGRVTAINLENNGLKGELFHIYAPQFSELTTLNLSRNQLTGDVSALVIDLSKLRTLNLSYNCLTEVSEGLPPTCTNANLAFQNRVWTGTTEYGLPTTDFAAGLPALTIPVIAGADQYVELPSLFTFQKVQSRGLYFPTWLQDEFSMLRENSYDNLCRLDLYYDYRTYTLQQDAPVWVIQESGIARQSAYPAILHYEEGDANMDGGTDVADVQHTLNYILAPSKVTYFNFSAGNTYEDMQVNVQDIVATVNIILDASTSTDGNSPRMAPAHNGETPLAQGTVFGHDGFVAVSADCNLAALDIEMSGVRTDQVALQLNRRDFQLVGRNTDSGSRYIIFSPTGKTIPAGAAVDVLRTSEPGTPVSVLGADDDARHVVLAIGTGWTGIETLDNGQASTAADVKIYNLSGQRMSKPRRGVNIVNGRKVVTK